MSVYVKESSNVSLVSSQITYKRIQCELISVRTNSSAAFSQDVTEEGKTAIAIIPAFQAASKFQTNYTDAVSLSILNRYTDDCDGIASTDICVYNLSDVYTISVYVNLIVLYI